MIELTDRARDALVTFHEAAARWNPGVCLRLVRAGTELRPELAEAPEMGDDALEVGAVTIYVEPGVDGLVDAGEHNVLTVVSE